MLQWKLANPTCTGREIRCRNEQGVGLHTVKDIIEILLNVNEHLTWITQGNGLQRCRIRQILLYGIIAYRIGRGLSTEFSNR